MSPHPSHSTKWNKSYSKLSKEYGVAVSAFKFWSKEGYDLNDESIVNSLVSKAKNKTKPVVPSSAPLNGRTISLNQSLGLEGNVARLRQVEIDLSKSYTEAISKGDPTAQFIMKQWLEVSDSLRRAEKESPDISKANLNSISVTEVKTEVSRVLIGLRTSLDSLAVRICKGLDEETARRVLPEIRAEVDLYIEELFSCKLI